MSQFLEKSSKSLLIFVIFFIGLAQVNMKMTITERSNLVLEQNSINSQYTYCLDYLAYDLQRDPITESNKWYGLKGKSLLGKTYQTGHAFDRHIAVDGKCTSDQIKQNKTVFYNLREFQSAARKIIVFCNVLDHTTFTYDYNGRFPSFIDYILGIDCKTGEVRFFTDYFVQFKRAIDNPYPTLEEYLNSDYLTIWTFYPKRT